MSGVMEILVVVLIIVGIFMLPRLLNRNPESDTKPQARGMRFSWRMRTAILASLLWPAALAFFLKPWNNHWVIFIYIAVGPVVLAWGIFWVASGFRKDG